MSAFLSIIRQLAWQASLPMKLTFTSYEIVNKRNLIESFFD